MTTSISLPKEQGRDEGDALQSQGPGSPLVSPRDGEDTAAIRIAPAHKPKIYCTVNGGSHEWWDAIAIAEDGTSLAGHICSSIMWAKHDLGVDNDVMGKHEKYRAHYPNGYEMVWIHPDEMRAQIQAQAGPMYEVYLRNKASAEVSDAQGGEAASSDAESGGDTADGPTDGSASDAPKPSNP